MSLAELQHNLKQIEKVVDIDALLEQPIDEQAIAEYYTESQYWYHIFHSTKGSVHLALNSNGVFNKDGYYGQARVVEHYLQQTHSQHVLELASGQGFNTRYLAQRNPGIQFVGLDLTPNHVRAAHAAAHLHANANFHLGNFQHLPYQAEQFDMVFVVESFCHANNMHRAFTEVFRVLRPGSRFIVFDGFRRSGFNQLHPDLQRSARLVEKTMAVGNGWILDEWLTLAQSVGFEVEQVRDLSEAIMPNVLRFKRLGSIQFTYPPFSRWVLRHKPSLVINAIPGRLIPSTLRIGAHCYQQVVLIRK